MDNPKNELVVKEPSEEEETFTPSEIFTEGTELLQEIVNAAIEEGKSLNKAVKSKRKTILGVQRVMHLFSRCMRISTVTFGRYEAALNKLASELADLKLKYGIEDEDPEEAPSEVG